MISLHSRADRLRRSDRVGSDGGGSDGGGSDGGGSDGGGSDGGGTYTHCVPTE